VRTRDNPTHASGYYYDGNEVRRSRVDHGMRSRKENRPRESRTDKSWGRYEKGTPEGPPLNYEQILTPALRTLASLRELFGKRVPAWIIRPGASATPCAGRAWGEVLPDLR
jgi:hypothetical protein